jgi:hypothetical protein
LLQCPADGGAGDDEEGEARQGVDRLGQDAAAERLAVRVAQPPFERLRHDARP